MTAILAWFLTPIGKWVGIILLVLGLLIGAKTCATRYHNAGVRAKVAEQKLRVNEADRKSQDALKGATDEEMAEYFRTGKLPPVRK